MKASEELREKMWELCYDLLPDDERKALVAQIKSDPQAARLYAEVRLQADLVGFAAKVEDSSLILSADQEKLKTGDAIPAGGRRKEATLTPAAVKSKHGPATAGRSWAGWLPAAAALVLVALIAYGVYRPSVSQDPFTVGLVATEIEMPAQMLEGLSDKLVVRSHSPQGQPVAADVEVKFIDEAGAVRHQEVIRTNASGVATVNAPGSAVQRGIRVEALARRLTEGDGAAPEQQVAAQLDSLNQLETRLPIQPQAPLTYFVQEKPVAQAGETTRFAIYSISRFGLESQPTAVADMEVQNAEGARVAQPMWTWNEDFVEGTIAMPPDPQAGEYSLAFRQSTTADRLGGEIERLSARQLAVLKQQEEVNQLAMRSRFSSPAPAATPQPDDKTLEEIAKESQDPDRQKRKQADEQQVLEQRAAAVADKPTAGSVPASAPVFEAGEPVTLSFPVEFAKSKNTVLEAYSRGVKVASQPVQTEMNKAAESEGDLKAVAAKDIAAKEVAEQQLSIDLPPEADGLVRIQLVDVSKSPPEVLREQTVYRQPARMLKVELADTQNEFQPGEQVKLRMRVLKENDQPAEAMLCVRVWSVPHIEASGHEPVMLADVVRSYSLADNEEQSVQLARLGKSLRELDVLAHDERRELTREAKKSEVALGGAAGTAPAAPAAVPPAPEAPQKADRDERAPSQAAADRSERAHNLPIDADAAPSEPMPAGPPAPLSETAAMTEKVAEQLAEAYYAPQPRVVSNKARVQQKYRALAAERESEWKDWRASVGLVLVIGGVVALAGILLLFLVKTPVRAASGTLTLLAATASLIVGAFWISGQDRHGLQIAAVPSAEVREDSKFARSQDGRVRLDATRELVLGEGVSGGDDYVLEDQVRLKLEPALAESVKDGESAAAAYGPATTAALDERAPAGSPGSFDAPGLESSVKPGAGAGGFGFPGGGEGGESYAKEGARMIAPGGLGGGKPQTEADKLRDNNEARPLAAESTPQAASAASRPSTRRAQGPASEPTPSSGPGIDRSAETRDEKKDAPPAVTALQSDKDRGGLARGDSADRPLEQPSDRAKQSAGLQNRGLRNELALPASLYFNPRLATDAEGYATIEFQMPEVESEYRVLIDAFGQGRIGSADVTIRSRK